MLPQVRDQLAQEDAGALRELDVDVLARLRRLIREIIMPRTVAFRSRCAWARASSKRAHSSNSVSSSVLLRSRLLSRKRPSFLSGLKVARPPNSATWRVYRAGQWKTLRGPPFIWSRMWSRLPRPGNRFWVGTNGFVVRMAVLNPLRQPTHFSWLFYPSQ